MRRVGGITCLWPRDVGVKATAKQGMDWRSRLGQTLGQGYEQLGPFMSRGFLLTGYYWPCITHPVHSACFGLPFKYDPSLSPLTSFDHSSAPAQVP